MKSLIIIFAFAFIANAQITLRILRIETPPKIDGVFSEGERGKAVKTKLAYQKEP